MAKILIFRGRKINLRRIRPNDLDNMCRLTNDKKVSYYLPMMPFPYGEADGRKYINSAIRNFRNRTGYSFAIASKEDDPLMGVISLSNINRADQNGEIGYWVARKYWNRGILTDALPLILDFSFRQMKLHRVYAIIHERNEASVRLMERAGFVREATWREGSFLGRRWSDVYAYGILKREFLKRAE